MDKSMKIKHKTAVWASPELTALKPLFKEWTAVVLDYCQSQNYRDNPWWYNERATLSTLAAAAWRIGWVALEEFSTTKRAKVPARKTEREAASRGRCDLFIGRPRDGDQFAIEAKQAWQSISRRGTGKDCIVKAAKMAWNDAGCLDADEADTRLALTFVIPYIPTSEVDRPGVQALVDEWLAKKPFQTERTAPRAYAYVFPKDWHSFINARGLAFPGVALLAEWRKRGRRRLGRTSTC